MMTDATFVCRDCGCAVYDVLGEVRERCWPCQWVHNIPDSDERDKLRQWLIELEVIEQWPIKLEVTDGK